MKTVGVTAVTLSAGSASEVASGLQSRSPFSNIKGLVFDAYGTLFDVFSVAALCERLFSGKGDALASLWRTKQLQYSLLRSLMGRYTDFWQLTEDGLVYAAKYLNLELSTDKRRQLMDAYLHLTPFPDVKPGLEALKKLGLRLAILSNGAPNMLNAVVKDASLDTLLDAIISVDEVKIFKPSPLVYKLAPAKLKIDVGALGFVSSNSWDVNGAASAGLTTFWIQRSAAEPPEQLGFAASRIVRAIIDLPAVLRPSA